MKANSQVTISTMGKWFVVSANGRQNYVFTDKESAVNCYLSLKCSVVIKGGADNA